ncbi:hypothetical protein [Aerosakkonema funiforme]|uniref:hypothetical protein n=1 Tax=Aerosakkonema funiforme TaxID=1246630 RepID=UPI0035BB5000
MNKWLSKQPKSINSLSGQVPRAILWELFLTYVKKPGFLEKSLLSQLDIDSETRFLASVRDLRKETGFLRKILAFSTRYRLRNPVSGLGTMLVLTAPQIENNFYIPLGCEEKHLYLLREYEGKVLVYQG